MVGRRSLIWVEEMMTELGNCLEMLLSGGGRGEEGDSEGFMAAGMGSSATRAQLLLPQSVISWSPLLSRPLLSSFSLVKLKEQLL